MMNKGIEPNGAHNPDETYKQQFEDDERMQKEQAHQLAELSQKAYQLLKEDYLAEAEDLFKEMLALESHNNYALVGLGDAARKRKGFNEAIEYYQRCLEHFPQNNYALFGLADCYKSLRHYHKAIGVWERYLEHDDRNVTVLTRVADAYRKVRNLQRSQELYLKVLQIEPDNAYALIGLGHLHYDFKDFEKAKSYWERIHQLHGESVDIRVLTSLGNCHRKLKTYADGLRYFEAALEREPHNFYALFGMADCYRGLNQQTQSLQYWNRILERDPDNKVILTRAGDAYRNMQDYDRAAMYYKKALNIEFDVYAVLGLALINKAQGKLHDAIESLEGLVKSDPKNHRLYTEIADCYVKLGQPQRALEVLGRFQKLGIRNRHVYDMYERLRNRAAE